MQGIKNDEKGTKALFFMSQAQVKCAGSTGGGGLIQKPRKHTKKLCKRR